MAAVICSRFPDKAPEMFAYLGTIVRAERNYEGQRWVTYDRQFRREALANKNLNWSVTDSRLYNEAFTGRAKAIARCSYCLQDDHADAYCPNNPNRSFLPCYPGPVLWQAPPTWPPAPMPPTSQGPSLKSQEICRRFNDGRCRMAKCKYLHACSYCRAPHPQIECPHRGGHPTQARSRSPFRPAGKGPFSATAPR
jgi:hypothetical protein